MSSTLRHAALGLAVAVLVTGAASANPAEFGALVLDREAGRFTVPGTVLRLDPPLEYLAVTRGGVKDYESLLSLDTDGKTFNLACILIGLEPPKGGLSAHQFDPKPLEGDRVRLWVSWPEGKGEQHVSVAALLKVQGLDATPDEWVYTGSAFLPDGRYLAELSGSLIGFVHDPASVIEHRGGLGLGNYGAAAGDPSRCPPVGSRVLLTVERVRPDGPAAPAH